MYVVQCLHPPNGLICQQCLLTNHSPAIFSIGTGHARSTSAIFMSPNRFSLADIVG